MKKETLNLTTDWDKTFPKSEKTEHGKVTFVNRYGITLAVDLYDGGKTNAIPFDKLERFFTDYLQ